MHDYIDNASYGNTDSALFLISLDFDTFQRKDNLKILPISKTLGSTKLQPMHNAGIALLNSNRGHWAIFCYYCLGRNIVWKAAKFEMSAELNRLK